MNNIKDFKTRQELQDYMQNNILELTNMTVETAFKLVKNKQKYSTVVVFHVEEDNINFKIVLNRKDLLITLEDNLITLENHEQYEMCAKVFELITKLKNELTQQNSNNPIDPEGDLDADETNDSEE